MRQFYLSAASMTIIALSACQADSPATVSEAPAATPAITQTDKPATKLEALTAAATAGTENGGPTTQEAKEFLEQSEIDITKLSLEAAKVYWIQANFITEDTNWLAAQAGADIAKLSTRLANEAKRFNGLTLPVDMRRKMDGLKRGSNFPAPEREGAAEELAEIMSRMDAVYGTAKLTLPETTLAKGQKILGEEEAAELEQYEAVRIMAESRDPELLQSIWEGWRTLSMPYSDDNAQQVPSKSVPEKMQSDYSMKKDYARMVELINEGAKELGYKDAGDLWRGGYDMPAEDFAKEVDRLWNQVTPLYDQLHCYVRANLNETYGDEAVPLDKPIRADLLGNMWAQQWGNIYKDVAPKGAPPSIDITKLLVDAEFDAKKMVETADEFFASLGFDPMPETFWQRSLITKPADRDVQCHASAWNLDDIEDIRIKMCTEVTGDDFQTVHHELGHNIYQRAYKDLPVFYKTGANDGFHEAIGDMIALSITPEYFVKIGLLDEKDIPGADADVALLLQQAMDKIAFLPFGLLVDKWRWQVFDGTLSPSEYNSGWWALREQYQGIRPPADRPADAFDPGAKYHIPGNTPYMRYFLAHILQFQFHKAACDIAGFEGPLHRCSIYGNEEVGKRFNAMMELGASKPWPDALEAFTGTRNMDGSAILEYFAPLMTYLEAENENGQCGWSAGTP